MSGCGDDVTRDETSCPDSTSEARNDVAAVGRNEAFAGQPSACLRTRGVDQEVVDAGGDHSGSPAGAPAARVPRTPAPPLLLSGEWWGVASLCIGVGQGLAVVLGNQDVRS